MKDLTMRRKIGRWKREGLSYERIGFLIERNRGNRIGIKPTRPRVEQPVVEKVVELKSKPGFFTRMLNWIMGKKDVVPKSEDVDVVDEEKK